MSGDAAGGQTSSAFAERPEAVTSSATVFIVDDNEGMRSSLRWLLEGERFRVETFASSEDFLQAYLPGTPGCLILDLRMPGMDGLRLQEHLNRLGATLPIIMVSAHAQVPSAVQAMKAGVIDFLEKPFSDRVLIECVQRALVRDAEQRSAAARKAELALRFAKLTERELDVLHLIRRGRSNKVAGKELGLSQKTIEHHRSRLMEKLDVRSLAELVQMALEHFGPPADSSAPEG